jgi:hypothetical protein
MSLWVDQAKTYATGRQIFYVCRQEMKQASDAHFRTMVLNRCRGPKWQQANDPFLVSGLICI